MVVVRSVFGAVGSVFGTVGSAFVTVGIVLVTVGCVFAALGGVVVAVGSAFEPVGCVSSEHGSLRVEVCVGLTVFPVTKSMVHESKLQTLCCTTHRSKSSRQILHSNTC